MKVNASNFFLEILSMLGLIVVAFVIAYAFSQHDINLYYFQWAAMGAVILSLIRNIKPVTIENTTRFNAWSSIIGFQLLVFILYYGISNYFGPHTFSQTILYNFRHLGFLPWGVMLLVAVTLRLITAKTQQDTSVIDVLGRHIPIQHGSQFWTILNLLIRFCANSIIGITTALVCLNILIAISGPVTHFSMQSIILSFIVILFAVVRKFFLSYTRFLQNKKLLFLTVPLFAIVIAIILGVIAYLSSGLATTLTKPPSLMKIVNACYSLHLTPVLFGQAWWLDWSIVGGVFIAHKSRQISGREMLAISAVVPLIISLAMYSQSVRLALTTHNWSVIFAIFAFICLLKMIFQRDTLPCTILSYLPAQAGTPKNRSHLFYMRSIIRGCLVILFFALPIGSQIPAIFVSIIVIPTALASLCFIPIALLPIRK
jgi:hypothetical protein